MNAEVTRRTFVLGSAAAAAGVAVMQPFGASTAFAAGTVDMEKLLIEAQVEPSRGNIANVGGGASTKLVQEALTAVGLKTTVDGYFGSGTVKQYAAWQRRLGYSGIDANGLPGPSSLAKLGEGRFSIVNRVLIGAREGRNGEVVNRRTNVMLKVAEDRLGAPIIVVQGSYTNAVRASAGTHGGGGAVDIRTRQHSQTHVWRMVSELRRVGFAAWYRTRAQGFDEAHIHAIAIGDTALAVGARNQVASYFVGRNGLSGDGRDDTPSEYRRAFTWYERFRRS